jgi:hypothetical protein
MAPGDCAGLSKPSLLQPGFDSPGVALGWDVAGPWPLYCGTGNYQSRRNKWVRCEKYPLSTPGLNRFGPKKKEPGGCAGPYLFRYLWFLDLYFKDSRLGKLECQVIFGKDVASFVWVAGILPGLGGLT